MRALLEAFRELLTDGGAVWSNFEIADMNFWRGEAYTAYFDYLEATGGFYYEVSFNSPFLDLLTNSILSPPFIAMGRRTCSQHSGIPLRKQEPGALLP